MWEKKNWPMANDDQGFSIQFFEIGKIFGESPPQKTKGEKEKEQKSVVNEFTLEIQKKIPKLLPNVLSQKKK